MCQEEAIRRARETYPGDSAQEFIDRGVAVEWFTQGARYSSRLPRPGDGCQCSWHTQDAGGGHFETIQEYEPSCPEHSEHVYNPKAGVWESSASVDRLNAVRKLHSPVPGEHDGLPVPGEHGSESFQDPGPYCSHCSTSADPVPHPCLTLEVLDGRDLDAERPERIKLNRRKYAHVDGDL